jgi:hypothetical protein
MAVSLDAILGTAKGPANNNAIITTTSAVAAAGRVVVVGGRFNTTAAGTFTPTATGLTFALDHNLTSGNLRAFVWSAPAPSGLAISTAITITPSGGGTSDSIFGALSLLGVDTASPVAGFNGAAASTAAWSPGSISASVDDGLVAGAFEDGSGTLTSTSTAPGVEAWDLNDVTQTEAFTGLYQLSLTGATTPAGTWSSAISHIAIGVAYKAAAGATNVLGSAFNPIPFMGGH